MFRIDSPNNIAAKPTYSAAGTAGYFQDTDAGGSTSLTADWFNHMQEELCGVVTQLGGTLSKSDDTLLWTALEPRVSGILSDATFGSAASTDHLRVIVASGSSQASGDQSVVLAGNSCHASGPLSACVAGGTNEVSGQQSAAIGGGFNMVTSSKALALGGLEGIVSGSGGILLGAYRTELHDSYAIGGGYGASAITAGSSNQNLSWLIKSNGGHAHYAGNLFVGDADVDAADGLSATFSVTGSTGALAMDGDLTLGGDIEADGSLGVDGNFRLGTAGTSKVSIDNVTGDVTTAGDIDATGDITGNSLTVTNGSNEVTETYTETVVSLAAGTHVTSTRSNSKIGANSIVLWSCDLGDPSATTPELIAQGNCVVTDEQATFTIANVGTGSISGTWTINYMVVNPK